MQFTWDSAAGATAATITTTTTRNNEKLQRTTNNNAQKVKNRLQKVRNKTLDYIAQYHSVIVFIWTSVQWLCIDKGMRLVLSCG
jgi:inosine/xanthosine triphosphate pyrophosphatase family protein